MPSSNVVDPVCPKNYTLQKDRMKYRLCKCIKKTDEKDYEYGNRLDTYKKVKRRVTVKKPGKRNRCPTGTRYNKKTGYCEGTTKQSRSLMSVLFKDGQEREIKTKRKTVKARVEKKRPKCPDGYVINHKLGLCERRDLRKGKRQMVNPLQRTLRPRTVKRKQPLGDSYYETVSPVYRRPKTVRPKTVRPKTVKLRPALKQTAKPRYNFRNTPFQKPKTVQKQVRVVEPTQRVQTQRVQVQGQKPEYVSLADYLARNQKTKQKTYRKTPAKTVEKKSIFLNSKKKALMLPSTKKTLRRGVTVKKLGTLKKKTIPKNFHN